MAPRGAMSQSKIFYTREWTEEVDKKFIETLVETSADRVYEVPDHLNVFQIAVGMGAVNKEFSTEFSYEYCVERATKLRKRFTVFKWITGLAGVTYDSNENIVTATDFVWDFICKKEKLGFACMIKGDADYPELLKIFGSFANANADGDQVDVVEISSDHSGGWMTAENSWWNEIAWYESDSCDLSKGDQEVNSPTVKKSLPFLSKGEGSDPSRSSTASNSPFKKFFKP